jgi:integrase-like protein
MKRATRFAIGSVVYDKRRRTWHLYTYENGKRHSKLIGRKCDVPNKSAARLAAARMQHSLAAAKPETEAPTVQELVTAYLQEKAPTRRDTRRSYQVWLRCHILPHWGDKQITDLQPRPIEMWLEWLRCRPRARHTYAGYSVASGTTRCGEATCPHSAIRCRLWT